MKERVYISGFLGKTNRGRHIAAELKTILGENLIEIPGPLHSKNEWCRDYMPVKASDGTNVLFRYMPSYILGTADEKTIPDQLAICRELNIPVMDDMVQDIIMDGGAIEVFGTKGIISDRVFSDNFTGWTKGTPFIYDEIKNLLKLDELIVVPTDPWDVYGHVDGLVRFIDESTVLINEDSDFEEIIEQGYDLIVYKKWRDNVLKTLETAGLKTVLLPFTAFENEYDDSAEGIYMNFLRLSDRIIMPYFDIRNKHFKKAKSILAEAYGLPVHEIESLELSEKGGVINCVTWND